MKSCPIFRGTGRKTRALEECKVCPFRDDCIQDIIDDASESIMESIGKYLGKKKKGKD